MFSKEAEAHLVASRSRSECAGAEAAGAGLTGMGFGTINNPGARVGRAHLDTGTVTKT